MSYTSVFEYNQVHFAVSGGKSETDMWLGRVTIMNGWICNMKSNVGSS